MALSIALLKLLCQPLQETFKVVAPAIGLITLLPCKRKIILEIEDLVLRPEGELGDVSLRRPTHANPLESCQREAR